MPIEMPKGLPFSVDTWTPASNRKRYHFLTHSHKDHLAGISSNSTYPIYSTRITRIIALHIFPQIDESLFVEIGVGEKVVIDDPDVPFTVTALDANHCPGAVMFLFEGEFGNVLHTGDCRLTSDCLQCLPMKFITMKGKENMCRLDYLLLDCTFVKCSLKLPSKKSAIQQVINCIWKHPSAPVVYLACDMLGQEEILIEVCRTFGSKIYVDQTNNSECFHALSLIALEILSEDASTRFQLIEGVPRLNERASQKFAEARANLQASPLFIRPSAQWYATNDHLDMTQLKKPGLSEAVMDEFGIWHVCYSIHSSREELEWALQLLQPKWVISNTPPLLAMELDYVKKHCYKTKLSEDDPLWKLVKLGPGKSVGFSSSAISVNITSVVAASANIRESNKLLQENLSPESSTNTITLFGRARLGLKDTDLLQEESISKYENHLEQILLHKDRSPEAQESNIADVVRVKKSVEIIRDICAKPLDNDKKSGEDDDVESSIDSSASKTSDNTVVVEEDSFCCGSSRNLNPSLRRLYRSMNVPVPRPLPSLVELMNGSKRVKFGFGSYSSSSEYI